jgi:hypothetical protein
VDDCETAVSVNQKLRRLSVRGKIELRLEMRNEVCRKWTEYGIEMRWPHGPGRQTITEFTTYNQLPTPYWHVTVDKFKRRYPATTDSRIKAWIYDQCGFNSEFGEGPDLEVVLDRLLMLTSPKDVDPMFDYCPGQFIPEEASA